jgi:acyl-CoA synthetase (AMP-forming)/AMP-acid ligase II
VSDSKLHSAAEQDLTVASILTRGYSQFRDLPAVIEPDGADLTYGELGGRARALVGGLQGLGIPSRSRVVVLTKNRPECFIIDHALAIGGYARVALTYRLHPREVAEIVEDAQASAVIVDGERETEVASALAELTVDPKIIALDQPSDEQHLRLSDLITGQEGSEVEVKPDDIAWMPYTSGTSGRPKGVIHTHRSLLAIIRNVLLELPSASTDDVLVHTAPLTHLSGYAMLAYFFRGASQIALGRFDAEELLAAVEQHRATVLPLVPTMINLLLPAIERGDHDVSSVHTVLYGGSSIAPERLARAIKALGPVFVQSYGLTEYPWASWMAKSDHLFDPAKAAPARLGSAGRISPYVQMRLVGAEGGLAPEGEPGEIQLRGDASMAGYWNLPVETEETILPGGWISTGDIGRIADGFLHIVDRKKDMIVSGGFNVYPTEVENAIYTLPGVSEVAVVGVPDEKWGETVCAVVVVRDGHAVSIEAIEQVCVERIASYKKPRTIRFVSELPKTGTGKIMRRALKESFWEGQDRMVGG